MVPRVYKYWLVEDGDIMRDNLFQEIKWGKVTKNYLEKYVAMMDAFFDIVAADTAKIRIMFTNNQYVPQGLTSEQQQTE